MGIVVDIPEVDIVVVVVGDTVEEGIVEVDIVVLVGIAVVGTVVGDIVEEGTVVEGIVVWEEH